MPAKRILLIEDDPDLHYLLSHSLMDVGYAVDVAPTMAQARQYLDETSYTLVIADWRLPDGDGLTIADLAADLGAKTFLMSGYLFGLPPGAADRHGLLMKPIRRRELLQVVERTIGKP